MARIRTIKPEFWTSEQVVECSPIARLLFVGMWNFCDDGGNHPVSAKTLKMQIFPGDDIAASKIEEMIAELVAAGLLSEYTADARRYWHVTGWKHQKIEKPSYKYPRPFADNSTNGSRTFDDRHPAEGKGREGKGMESSVVEPEAESGKPAATAEPSDSEKLDDPSETPEDYLARITRHDNANAPVTMSLDWKPGAQFPAMMIRAGLAADKLTDEILASFQIYNNGNSKPQNQWEAALVTWCKRERTEPENKAAAPEKQSTGPVYKELKMGPPKVANDPNDPEWIARQAKYRSYLK